MLRFRMTANQGLLRIFFALLLVAIIMFTSNYMVFRNSISGIYNEVKENNQLVVKNIIRSFDESFKDVNDIIFNINVLPYRAIDGSGNLDMHSVYMLQKQIGTVISANNYIEDVVLFYKGADLAITSTGTIDLRELIGQKYNNRTYTAAYWKSTASSKHPQKIYPADYYSARNGPSRKLLVVLSNNQVADQNIMVFMDADKLLRQSNQEAMMEGTSLLVLDEERNAVLNTEDSWDLVQLLNDMNRGVGPDGTVQRKDYEYTFYRSDFNGFLYINKAPYQFANLQSVASANRTIMGIAIGIAILLSILLSRYLYKPVSQIVKLVGGRERGTADFGTILAGVGRLQKENERLKEQLELDRADMRRDAFLQALDGVPLSRTKELRTQQSFSEFFQEKGFVLASFQLRPEPGGEGPLDSVEELAEAIQAGLGSRLTTRVFVFHASRLSFLALIGVKRSTEREETVRQIRSFLERAEEGAWQGFSATAAVSRFYESKIGNCPAAYRDLLDCRLYRQADSRDAVTDYGAIRFTWKAHFPLDEIEKAANTLAGGHVADCQAAVDAVLTENVQRHVHHHQLDAVARTLFYCLLRPLEMSDADGQDILGLESAFLRKLEVSLSVEEIREALFEAAEIIAAKGASSRKTKLNPAAIAHHLKSSYRENLHLDAMAEAYGTTPKYFSNYFKKTFGVNFVDYLNRVRLSHAKELLKTTDKSVSEIGELTGYLNSSTFTNTFKKYYGLSPSDYRRNEAADQSANRRRKL